MISRAYERTSVIVTTNLPFEQWTEVLGSERLTGATLDRLTHRCRSSRPTGRATGCASRSGVSGVGRRGMPEGVGRGVDARREAGYSRVTVPHFRPPPAALLQCRPHKADASGKLGILHVKCVVGDGRWLFLSSANLTKYAFSLNMELGVLITGGKAPQIIEAMFETLIREGVLAAVS